MLLSSALEAVSREIIAHGLEGFDYEKDRALLTPSRDMSHYNENFNVQKV